MEIIKMFFDDEPVDGGTDGGAVPAPRRACLMKQKLPALATAQAAKPCKNSWIYK